MHRSQVPNLPLPSVPDESGDIAQAFQRGYESYLDPLCRFVYAYVKSWDVARDLVSDVFAKLWLRLAAAEPVDHMQAFLYRTARNQAIDYLRRQEVRARYHYEQSSSDLGTFDPPDGDNIEQRLAERELVAMLQRAVDQLSPQQRQVVLLRWRGEATNVEAAATLGIAPNTASEHFHRALEHLRAILPEMLRDLR